jgi:hypothetical protein
VKASKTPEHRRSQARAALLPVAAPLAVKRG